MLVTEPLSRPAIHQNNEWKPTVGNEAFGTPIPSGSGKDDRPTAI